VFGTLLIKLVSENKINWDEHLFIMLFSYKIAYKVATRYTPYQLMYGLRPLMPTKYIVPIVGGNERDNTSVRVLTNRLQSWRSCRKIECMLQKLPKFNSGIEYYGINKRI